MPGAVSLAIAQLFPSGLDFLKLAFEREWAESEQRLEQIANGDMKGPLESLARAALRPIDAVREV